MFDDLEEFAKENEDKAALANVRECREALERLIHKMDGLESGFDRIAERSRAILFSSFFSCGERLAADF